MKRLIGRAVYWLEHSGMKSLSRQRKAEFGTSGKRRIHAGRSSVASGRARSNGTAQARAALSSSALSLARVIGHQPNLATTDLRQPEPVFQTAVKNFELGARAFHRQNFERAKEIFEKLASSGVAGVAERARVHLRLCEQRLSRPAPVPKKAEDLYTLGVGALNSRRLDDAIEYLNKAQKSAPKLEHIRYALAAAYSLRGDAEDALENLKQAIALRPQNRLQARRDEDFRALAADVRFRELVFNSGLYTERLK